MQSDKVNQLLGQKINKLYILDSWIRDFEFVIITVAGLGFQ